MEHSVQPLELIRPWRTATFVAAGIAAIELVALVVAGLALLSGPLARQLQHDSVHRSTAAAKRKLVQPGPTVARLARSQTAVLVLNGNGQSGAAASAAQRLRSLSYMVASVGNATQLRAAPTVVMYRPGYRPEALRLAHDFGFSEVGPLDGLRPSGLRGAQLAVILGQ